MTTQLNSIAPAAGSKHPRRRLGRGVGSGLGKTSGRGHKGLKSRSGGSSKPGFEGGQMPLQRRLPKRGFNSPTRHLKSEIRLGDLNDLPVDEIDLQVLKAAGLVGHMVRSVKVINTGEVSRRLVLRGLRATAGAKTAIEAAGGSVE